MLALVVILVLDFWVVQACLDMLALFYGGDSGAPNLIKYY